MRNGRRQDRQQLLTYASINDAPLYRAIIEIFITAADAYQTRLRLADVLAVLSERGGWPEPVDLTELDRRLEQLCEWGNLYHERDDALTNSLAEFEGRGYVYYLTPGGEAAHAAVEALEDGLERTGGLQTAMLRHILDVLEATVVLVRTGGDDDQLFTTLEDLHASFRALTANATLFMQTVSRVLHAPALDPERFQAFKAETVAYLTTFIDDLGTLTTAICVKLADWDALPGQQVTSALRRAGAASGQRDLERPDLDYWAWFTFTVQWAKHGGPLGKLTRREHAALSGGEKAVTLHLPLFAAAAAYYHAASVACPRLIVLDEMFTGVDDELRGQLFELIVNFDLDLLATSERETGTHAELDGISVYQLVAYAGASWILALRSMWDGERLLRSFEEELLNDPDDDQDLPADRDDILPMTT